jgi:hypothetical protein
VSGAAEWFERQFLGNPPTITDDHRRCLEVLAAVAPLYNIVTPCPITEAVELWANGGVSIITSEELATFDAGALTRLVVAAHRDLVRVAVRCWSPDRDEERAALVVADYRRQYDVDLDPHSLRALEITLQPRNPFTPGASCWDWHPDAATLAATAIQAHCAEPAAAVSREGDGT